MGWLRTGCLALTIASAALFANALTAQTVRVESGAQSGHGLMVRHQNTCYLVTARHVVEGQHVAAVRSAAPIEPGTATMQTPFWEGMDLAVGVLRGAIEARCTLPFSRLAGGLAAETVNAPELVRLRDTGEVERAPLGIAATGYLSFTAELMRPEDTLYRGSSGAFAMAGDRPLGMVITTSEGRLGEFIRIEEIEPNLRRWITRRVALDSGPVAAEAGPDPEVGIAVRLVSAARPPIGSEFVPENLLGAGAYIFEPGVNRIEFRMPGNNAEALSRVVIETAAEAGHAMPHEVRIDVSSAQSGGGWRHFLEGEVAPDGVLDMRRSPQLARWVAVTVLTARSAGPVRIDSIRFE